MGKIYIEVLSLNVLFSNKGVQGLPGLQSTEDIPYWLGPNEMGTSIEDVSVSR